DTDIRAGLAAERRALADLRQATDALVDTGTLTVHVLRALIQERYGRGEGDLAITLLSFGFKHGIPAEADVVLDVRFLPNPFFVPQLSALSGEDEAVVRCVMDDPETKAFLDGAVRLVKRSVQGFRREGKSYATVAIGCTGGRHRSVAIAKELGRRLGAAFSISIRHRDIAIGYDRGREVRRVRGAGDRVLGERGVAFPAHDRRLSVPPARPRAAGA